MKNKMSVTVTLKKKIRTKDQRSILIFSYFAVDFTKTNTSFGAHTGR